MCWCGHNPFLTAVYVHDLFVREDTQSGLETISYVLPPIYSFNLQAGKRELVREANTEVLHSYNHRTTERSRNRQRCPRQ